MFGNFSHFKTPFPGRSSIPTFFVSLFIFYIFSYLLSRTMGYVSGCLMSSAGIQKLFCGIYSVFKCSFDEFLGEKVVSLSYSSTILGPSASTLHLKQLENEEMKNPRVSRRKEILKNRAEINISLSVIINGLNSSRR